MMTFTGRTGSGRSILHSAADSGSKAVVKAVFAALGERLSPQEVHSTSVFLVGNENFVVCGVHRLSYG